MKQGLIKGLAFVALLTNLNAETTTCSAVSTVNTSIESLNTSVANQQKLVSKLSDDIGVMADRIGTMADRIVDTEKLLSDTLIVLTGNADLGSSSSATTGVVLMKPLDGATVSKDTAPTIKLSTSSSKYLLYASTEPTFGESTTISLYIESTSGLNTSWAQIVNFAGSASSIYIAVKNIDENNKISSLSNGVKLTLQ